MAVSPNDPVVGFRPWLSHAFRCPVTDSEAATSADEARRLTRELSLGIAVFIVKLQLPEMLELAVTLRRESWS